MIAALAAKHLISPEKLRSELTAAAAQAGTAKAELRPAIVKILKTALEQSHTLAEQQLVANGEGTRCAESLSLGEDEIIRSLFIFPNAKQSVNTPIGQRVKAEVSTTTHQFIEI